MIKTYFTFKKRKRFFFKFVEKINLQVKTVRYIFRIFANPK